MLIEGSLEAKFPTIWTDGKAEVGRVREEKESVERRSEKRKSQKKEDAKHCFSNVLWLRRAWKLGSLKRRVRSHLQRRDDNFARRCGAKHVWKAKWQKHLMLGALLEVSMFKEHAIVARSTFGSRTMQNKACLGHFWKLRCWTSALCCGAKQV